MPLGRHERIDRHRRALPKAKDVLQAARNEIGCHINPRFQHHAVPGERPVVHGVSTVGPQTAPRLEVHEICVRSFETPGQRGIVVAQTQMAAKLAERIRTTAAIEIGRSSDQYSAIIRKLVQNGAAVSGLTDPNGDVDLLVSQVNQTILELQFNVEARILFYQLSGER